MTIETTQDRARLPEKVSEEGVSAQCGIERFKGHSKAPKTGLRRKHTIRTRDGGMKTFVYGRKQAIFLLCVECLGWDDHPNVCTSKLCPVYPFRGQTMASQRGDVIPT
jgi:hypothetical protein